MTETIFGYVTRQEIKDYDFVGAATTEWHKILIVKNISTNLTNFQQFINIIPNQIFYFVS